MVVIDFPVVKIGNGTLNEKVKHDVLCSRTRTADYFARRPMEPIMRPLQGDFFHYDVALYARINP